MFLKFTLSSKIYKFFADLQNCGISEISSHMTKNFHIQKVRLQLFFLKRPVYTEGHIAQAAM